MDGRLTRARSPSRSSPSRPRRGARGDERRRAAAPRVGGGRAAPARRARTAAALAALVAIAPGRAALARARCAAPSSGSTRPAGSGTWSSARPPRRRRRRGRRVGALVVEALPVRLLATLRRAASTAPPVLDAAARPGRGAPRAPASRSTTPDLDAAAARVRGGARAARATARRGSRRAARGRCGELRSTLDVPPGEPVRVARASGSPASRGRLRRALAGSDARGRGARRGRPRRRRPRGSAPRCTRAGYRRARVGAPERPRRRRSRADVELPVDAGPRLAFAFRGNARDRLGACLERQLGLEEGQPVDAAGASRAAADRLRAFYRARGYAARASRWRRRGAGAPRRWSSTSTRGGATGSREVRLEGRRAAATRRRCARGSPRSSTRRAAEPATTPTPTAARALLASDPRRAAAARRRPRALAPQRGAGTRPPGTRAAERLVDDYRADGLPRGGVPRRARCRSTRAARVADVDAPVPGGPAHARRRRSRSRGTRAVSLAGARARVAARAGRRRSRSSGSRRRAPRSCAGTSRAATSTRASRRASSSTASATAPRCASSSTRGRRSGSGASLVTGNRRTREEVVRGALAFARGRRLRPRRRSRRARRRSCASACSARWGSASRSRRRRRRRRTSRWSSPSDPGRPLAQGVGFSIANGPRAFVEYGAAEPARPRARADRAREGELPARDAGFRPDLARQAAADRIEGRADVGLRDAARSASSPFPAERARANVIGEILHRKAYDARAASPASPASTSALTSRASLLAPVRARGGPHRADATRSAFLTQADVERLRFDEGSPRCTRSARPSRSTTATTPPTRTAAGSRRARSSTARSLGAPARTTARSSGSSRASGIHTNMLKLSGDGVGVPAGRPRRASSRCRCAAAACSRSTAARRRSSRAASSSAARRRCAATARRR